MIISKAFNFQKKKAISVTLIPLVIFTGTGIFYLFNPFAKKAEAAWFNDNWAFRKPISFTHNAAVSNTQVELDIDTTDSPDKFQADCGDVRFTDINGNLLRYFLDSAAGACDTASTDFDVLIPLIVNGTNVIYMYYGNPSAANGSEPTDFTEATTSPSGGAPSAGTEVKGPSPTLYWKFDDGQGTNAQDFSSNNLDGTLNNTPTWQTEDFCLAGKCIWFDGTNNENVSLADPSSGSLDFTLTDNFTVQAWVKRNGASSANTVIINKASDNLGATYQGYKLYMDASGDFCFATRDGTNAEDSACTSGVEFDDDKWHHVAGTKQGRTVIRLYVDGYERASDTSIESTGSLANSGTFYTGVDSDGTSNEWLGFIDEVKVYRDETVRSAAQIAADFNARSNNKGASVMYGPQLNNNPQALNNGLVGYWKEDETTNGAVATDSSGNATSLTDSGTVVRTSGKFGNGGDFESTSSQYQFAADNAVLSITGSLTLAAWIKPESVSAGTYNIITKWDGANESYRLYQSADELVLEIETGNTVTTDAANLAASTIYHVAGIYDASAQKARIYINGVESGSTTAGTIPSSIGDDGGAFHIGAEDRNNTPKNFYDGIIDEARVYNRAFSSAEISQLYNFAPGPSGYWKFDEKSGTTANDISSNANSGSITGATWTNGKFGSALDYDGTDDVTTVTNATAIDLNSSGAHTFSAWVYADSAGEGSGGQIYNKGNTTFLRVDTLSGNNLDVEAQLDLATTDATLNISTAVTTGTWNHIAVTYEDDSDDEITIYVNGVNRGSSTNGDGSPAAESSNLLIGGPTTDNFDGKIDDFKMYNYARTPGQIIEDMNAGHPAPGSPVGSAVAYWKMDEGYGTTANDSSTNDNDLTLSSASWTNSGKFGKAWNGTGALWLSRADDADFDFAAAEDFSISLWFKSDAAGNPTTAEYLVSKGPTAAVGYAVYTNTTDPGNGVVCFGIDDDVTWDPDVSSCTTTDYYDATWHHVVAVRNTTLDKTFIYIDGLERDSDTDTTTATLANSSTLYVGDLDGADNGSEFNGDLDEVKVFRLALTADQVKQEFNRGSAQVLGALSDNSTYQVNAANQEYCVPGDSTSCGAPFREWKLDEKTGTTANDSSTNDGAAAITTGIGGWTNGKLGNAFNFDGQDTKIQTTDTFTVPAQMTVELWMYARTGSEAPAPRFFHLQDASDSVPDHRVLTVGIGSNSLRVNMDWTSNGNWETGTNVFSANKWTHLATTYDSSSTSNDPIIYVNGVVQTLTTDSNPTGTFDNSASNGIIGNEVNQSTTFDGIIDHVRFFNYVRSPAQIAWDYNRGGPVGYWKFDECQGTSLNDSAGNSLTGTWNGAASGSQTAAGDCNSGNSAHAWNNGKTGKRNYSLNFDGTDDYVNVVDNNVLDVTTGLTLSAWINKAALGTTKNMISKWSNQGGIGNQYSYYMSVGDELNDVSFQVDNDGDPFNAGSGCSVTTTTTISASTWYHIAATFNSGTLKIYRDGIEQPTTSSGTCTSSLYQGTAPLNIGSVESGTQNWWNGQIDDARVYNYPLTANQVRILMNQGGALRYGPATGPP